MLNMDRVAIRFIAAGLALGALLPMASAAQSAGGGAGADLAAAPAIETRAEKLDRLFGELATAEPDEAAKIAEEIRGVWARSGSDSMDLLLKRARSDMRLRRYDRARAHLSALTRLAPDFAEGWNAAATLAYLQEDFARAMADIERAVALEPRHFSALAGLAMVLERVGRPAAALKAWREIERLHPTLDKANEAIERLSPEVDGHAL
ncbi:tetratricopeptide repeat protein [Pikeienuella sp. HZG-20]|uniref:tetratricopeptide repeat protein n=1 Tax=Paludibacillus litoralis TaxID=3133267 RepID=UPI0030EC534D